MFASRLEESPVTVAGPVPKTRVMAPAIVFDNVSFAFDEQVVLRGISFTVPPGGHEDPARGERRREVRRCSSLSSGCSARTPGRYLRQR